MPFISRVTALITAPGIVIEAPDDPSVGRDAEGKTLPRYSVWHYIVGFGRQLDLRHFLLMRFDGDRLQERDEAGVPRDTAIYVWLRRWKHWGLKRASFLLMTVPTTNMPFVWCYEER